MEVDRVVRALLIFVDVSVYIFGAVDENKEVVAGSIHTENAVGAVCS